MLLEFPSLCVHTSTTPPPGASSGPSPQPSRWPPARAPRASRSCEQEGARGLRKAFMQLGFYVSWLLSFDRRPLSSCGPAQPVVGSISRCASSLEGAPVGSLRVRLARTRLWSLRVRKSSCCVSSAMRCRTPCPARLLNANRLADDAAGDEYDDRIWPLVAPSPRRGSWTRAKLFRVIRRGSE